MIQKDPQHMLGSVKSYLFSKNFSEEPADTSLKAEDRLIGWCP